LRAALRTLDILTIFNMDNFFGIKKGECRMVRGDSGTDSIYKKINIVSWNLIRIENVHTEERETKGRTNGKQK